MNTQLYFAFSQDIEIFLQENNVSLQYLLDKNAIDGTLEYSSDPSLESEDEREKAIIPKIITSSVAAVLVISSLTSLLEEVYRQPYIIEVYESQELRDSKGEVIFDNHGNPKTKMVKKVELIQPKQDDLKKEMDIKLDFTKGVFIKIKELRR
jgi:hypothetical protein